MSKPLRKTFVRGRLGDTLVYEVATDCGSQKYVTKSDTASIRNMREQENQARKWGKYGGLKKGLLVLRLQRRLTAPEQAV